MDLWKIDTLDEALEALKTYSIRNTVFKGMPPIDWNVWSDKIDSFRQSNPLKDDISVLRYALDELHDGHSGIINEELTNGTIKTPPMPVGRLIGKTAYLRLPEWNRTNDGDDRYTVATHNIIKELDQSDIEGWIVDLRINSGGDHAPMLEGIGPLLGNGTHAYLIHPQFNFKEQPCEVNTAYRPQQANKPIAVLTGSGTNSSGELILLAFQKLENVKTFGANSAGNSSSNPAFKFQDRVVAFTAGFMADRDKVPYEGKIRPDVAFTGGARPQDIKLESYDPATDELVKFASQWIRHTANPIPKTVPMPPAPF